MPFRMGKPITIVASRPHNLTTKASVVLKTIVFSKSEPSTIHGFGSASGADYCWFNFNTTGDLQHRTLLAYRQYEPQNVFHFKTNIATIVGDIHLDDLMGTHLSKVLDPECALGPTGKRESQDEMLSKSTDTTVDSSFYPPYPEVDSSRDVARSQLNQIWRSGARRSKTMPDTSRRRKNPDSQRHSEGPYLRRRDSDPLPPNQGTCTVPVKCPPRKTNSASGQELAMSHTEGEDAQYLMRLYDSRTWEMYLRITEARKGSQYSQSRSINKVPDGEAKFEWENLQHDHTESSYGDEMIFLFDFD
jgi:hypothetical protein